MRPNQGDIVLVPVPFTDLTSHRRRPVIVVCNFTPVPRHGWRLGVPEGASWWREALNTDSAHYGGSNLGNGGGVAVQSVPSHGRAQSVELTLPPLATLFLVPG